jgi:ferredoxin-nitrite reductase
MGGKVGKDAHLGEKVMQGIPCDELPDVLKTLLMEHFQAQPRADGDPSGSPVSVTME